MKWPKHPRGPIGTMGSQGQEGSLLYPGPPTSSASGPPSTSESGKSDPGSNHEPLPPVSTATTSLLSSGSVTGCRSVTGSRLLEFIVPGDPVPQPRGRAVRRGKFVKVLSAEDDHKVWIWRDRVIYEAKKATAKVQAENTARLVGPLVLSVLFVTPFTGTPRKKLPNPRRWNDAKKDLDNLMKSLKDALTEAQVWGDDGQVVCYGRVAKVRAAHGELPHTVVRIDLAGEIGEVWA